MHLDRLIAALGPIEVANAAPLEIAELAYDTRAVRRGIALLLRPGRDVSTATTSRPRRSRAGAVALVVERLARRARCRSCVVAERARGDARRRGRVLRRPVARARRRRRHRDEREDDLGVPARDRSSTRRDGSPALLTNIERRVGGEVRPTGLNTPEAIDLQRLFREMLDGGRPLVRDGGDVDRGRARGGSTARASPCSSSRT